MSLAELLASFLRRRAVGSLFALGCGSVAMPYSAHTDAATSTPQLPATEPELDDDLAIESSVGFERITLGDSVEEVRQSKSSWSSILAPLFPSSRGGTPSVSRASTLTHDDLDPYDEDLADLLTRLEQDASRGHGSSIACASDPWAPRSSEAPWVLPL